MELIEIKELMDRIRLLEENLEQSAAANIALMAIVSAMPAASNISYAAATLHFNQLTSQTNYNARIRPQALSLMKGMLKNAGHLGVD